MRICDEAITALRAALAGPCPCGDRPADQCPGEWEPGCDLGNNPKYAKRAEPKGGGNLPPPLQAEPVAAVAENATTQQFVGETPPSDYRRGYWDGFNIGKREGRIEAEDALAQQALEPVQEQRELNEVLTERDDAEDYIDAILNEVLGPDRAEWSSAYGRADALEEVRERIAQMLKPSIDKAWNRFEVALAQQDEPVEPVAWSGYDLDGMVEAFSRVIEAHHSSKHPFHNPIDMDAKMALRILRGFIPAMKAYAAPPQRKPLTEEEIDKIFKHLCNTVGASCKTMARAVERAHGIKE